MVAIRDLQCGSDIAKMAALGKFAEEFIVYGCCYIKDDQIFYKVSSQDNDLYHFTDACLETGIYPSPVREWVNRTLVPSGMQEEYLYRTKILLAKQLQQDYPEDLLQKFTMLARTEGNDTAADLLYSIKKKLIGCFDWDILQMFWGLVTYAYQQKKLRYTTYQQFQQWLQDIGQQMEDDVVIRKNFQRTFWGFAYRDQQERICYYANAKQGEVRKRREALMCKGILGTAMMQKTYCYDQQPNLAMVRKAFLQQLEQRMNPSYWQILSAIHQYPSTISASAYQQLLDTAKIEGKEMMEQYLRFYQAMWLLTT